MKSLEDLIQAGMRVGQTQDLGGSGRNAQQERATVRVRHASQDRRQSRKRHIGWKPVQGWSHALFQQRLNIDGRGFKPSGGFHKTDPLVAKSNERLRLRI